MKGFQKAIFLFGISCLLLGLVIAPYVFFFIRSLEPVEVDTFQADEEFQVADRTDYMTYRTSDEEISCNEQGAEKSIHLFQESESDIAFTSEDFLLPVDVICNSEVTVYKETSPKSLRMTSGLLIAAPVFIGVGVWSIRNSRKSNQSR